MHAVEREVISTGCDWITGVATEAQSSTSLSLWVGPVLDYEQRRGNVIKAWGMAGFSGWSVGEVQVGQRGPEMMVRLSSEQAMRNWRKVYEVCDNITRLDWQITFKPKRPVRQFIHSKYRQALHHSKKLVRGPSVTLVTGSDGGDTLYLGKRQSDVMGRLYNKGVESKDLTLEGYARAELELKGKLAKIVARSLDRSKSPFKPGFDKVASFFSARGASLGLVHDL